MNNHFNKKNSLCLTVAEALALGNLPTLVCAWLGSPTFVLKLFAPVSTQGLSLNTIMTHSKLCGIFNFDRDKSCNRYSWHHNSPCKEAQ